MLKNKLNLVCLSTLSVSPWNHILSFFYREERVCKCSISIAVSRYCSCLKMDLFDTVKTNDLEHVILLLEQGADKDEGDSGGCTPLYRASAHGYFEVTQYLVERGAALDKASNIGYTPLAIATIKGHLEICRYLLEQGADRDKAQNDGWTPLHFAASFGHLEIAVLLMSYGADLNARTNDGRLPIDMGYRNTEEIKQAIRDEPRRRMDEAPGKRATEQDRHPNAAIPSSSQQEEDDEQEEQSNKRPRLDEGTGVEEDTKVAEEDEDSEPSSDEGDD